MNQEKLFSAILQNVHDGIIAVDARLVITFVNPAARKMSQWKETDPTGTGANQLFTLLEPKNLTNLLTKQLPQGEEPLIFRDAIYKSGSHTLIVDGSVSRIPEEDGEAQGYVLVIRDISDLKKLSASLDYQVSHDPLTGLVNREGFMMHLDDVLDSVKRIGSDCALIQIEIDTYETVKTETGDSGGNALLVWLTKILQSHVKNRDIPARMGGGVFALILFECTAEEAERAVDRIRESAGEGFSYGEKQFPVTVSAGVVPINDKAAFAAGLLASVSALCTSAKKAGGGKTMGPS